MPKTDLILVKELENGDGYKTGFIILNSPDTLNSLTLDMVKTISDQLRNWSNDPYLAAVSIEGAGEKAFCAGGDIRALYESMLRNPGGPNPFSEEFFEQEYENKSCCPTDTRLQFLNVLLEDFGDEYLPRFSMHYRWGNEQNRQTISHRIARSLMYGNEHVHPKQMAPMILQRQTGFDGPLGLNTDEVRSSMDQQLLDLLAILDKHFTDYQFLLGDRPSLADFAIYAHLYTHLLQDPFSAEIMECHGARTINWIDTINEFGDVRGCLGQTEFGDWLDLDEGVPESLKQLLEYVSKTYVPFSAGVAKAVQEKSKKASALVYGVPTEYAAFQYRAWSLEQVQLNYQTLSDDNKSFMDELLTQTHVLPELMDNGIVHIDLFDGFTPPFVKDGVCDARVRYLKQKKRKTAPEWA